MKKGIENACYVPGLISIIIPVYNIKNYLDTCLESVVRQSYSNIEILLIDDGSTDGSGKLCDIWHRKDNRIRVFHKKNGGASRARNLGLKKARGEFLGFVDGDDYVAEDMYECLIYAMKEGIDISCCGTAIIYPAKMRKQNELYGELESPVLYTNREAIKELLLVRELRYAVWDKLYRRELFQNVRFPEGKTCEDYPVTYEIVKKSRGTVNIGEIKYFYRYREGSMTKQQFKLRRMSYVLFTRDILQDVARCYPKERKCAEALYIRSVVDTLRDIGRSTRREEFGWIERRLRKLLRRMSGSVLTNPYIPEITKKDLIRLIFKTEI